MRIRKFTMLALAGIMSVSAWAQGSSRQKFIASPSQLNPLQNVTNVMRLTTDEPQPIASGSGSSTGHTPPPPAGRVSSLSAVLLGSATNIYTIINGDGNQVSFDSALNMVTFTHRNNHIIYGGSSGELRYDLSTDGGVTWNSDIGSLNPNLTLPARYPQGAIYNPAGNTDPLQAMNLYYAPTIGVPTWDGYVYGLSSTVTSGSPSSTEHYPYQGTGTSITSGLTENHPGEFWVLDNGYDGTNVTSDIRIFKGIVSANDDDITFTEQDSITPDHARINNKPSVVGPKIAWKPETGGSNLGWIAFLGDLVGAPDSALMPVFIKTTDGGNTWGDPIVFDLNTITWIKDTLQSLWIDSLGNPASSGEATCAFDFDLTVDMNGNPHLVVVVGTQTFTSDYSIVSGYAKFLADCYSTDGGATWNVNYISPVLTFRTNSLQGTTCDNQPQISRSSDGSKIFYAWVDSDTALVTLSKNGIGFGEVDNLAPNLRVAGLDVTNGFQSYPQLVTDRNLAFWGGQSVWPTMAPVAIPDGANGWKLPIVMPDISGLNGDPINFYYMGNDIRVSADSMYDPLTMTLTWPNILVKNYMVGVKPPVSGAMVLGNAWPNPTSGEAIIPLELSAVKTITLDLVNVLGQQVALIAEGEFAAGRHSMTVETDKLAPGVYYYNLRTDDQVLSKKLVVVK